MIVWLFIIGLLMLGTVIASIVQLLSAKRRSPGLKVLDERYARGEINRDEYLQKRDDLFE
jgi:putative membrane protein